ncbi:sigma-70 family RNA polymerase sigma factor [Streptomyces davaonensis]|nr:sigma-70 family RNA polymerase sigma factor [Streptomyces davaonensis]
MTRQFEEHRARLRAVAYRMLGSVSEADDAVQDAWLRVDRADTSEVHNPGGWLTTVVARVCLNQLRARETRREEALDAVERTPVADVDPEEEALLADSVGVALLIVLDTLAPAERLTFVLHDMFQVPFDEIGLLLEKSPVAARQLASRARRRIKGAPAAPDADLQRRREAVGAYLAATRAGDFDALLALLHPDVVLHADPAVVPTPEPVFLGGARTVAQAALASATRAAHSALVLVDGRVGIAFGEAGRLRAVLRFSFDADLITAVDIIGERARLAELELAVP